MISDKERESERGRTGRKRRRKKCKEKKRRDSVVAEEKKERMALRYLCLAKPNVKNRVVNATKRKERSEVRKHATEAIRFPRLVAVSRF